MLSVLAYDTVRALTEINASNQADAYPWISPDGLRLYYTNGTPSNHLMYTSRVSPYSLFTTPVTVTVNLTGATSYWLSHDELDVYICTSNSLFYAQRTTVSSSFNVPVQIILVGGPDSTSIKGASLNANQNELFVYMSFSSGTPCIAQFSRSSATSFSFTKKISLPTGYAASPGQISKDGLTLFFGASVMLILN